MRTSARCPFPTHLHTQIYAACEANGQLHAELIRLGPQQAQGEQPPPQGLQQQQHQHQPQPATPGHLGCGFGSGGGCGSSHSGSSSSHSGGVSRASSFDNAPPAPAATAAATSEGTVMGSPAAARPHSGTHPSGRPLKHGKRRRPGSAAAAAAGGGSATAGADEPQLPPHVWVGAPGSSAARSLVCELWRLYESTGRRNGFTEVTREQFTQLLEQAPGVQVCVCVCVCVCLCVCECACEKWSPGC